MPNNELPILEIYYRNYKGVCAIRKVQDPKMFYGKTEHHPKMQWLIRAFDIDKDDFRDFSVAEIIHFN